MPYSVVTAQQACSTEMVNSITSASDKEILVLTVISTNLIDINHYKIMFLYEGDLCEIFHKSLGVCSVTMLHVIYY